MPEPDLVARSAFANISAFSRTAGLAVAERVGLGIATLAARKGRAQDLADALRLAYAVELRPGSKVSRAGPVALVGTGPGTWLAVCHDGGWRFARDLAEAVEGSGSVCDQSSGYGVLRLSGPAVRRTLAKGVPVDLDPSAFVPGDAAVTLAAHVGIVLWQVDEAPTYDVAVFRSYAASFNHWLAASAAEFGLAPAPPVHP